MATFPPHELTCAPRVPATSSPVTAERAMGLSAGTRSLSCPLSRDSRSVDVTTESYSPQSRSPSSVLFSLVSTRLQRFVMKGFIFSPWPTLNHLPPSFPVALKNYFILFYFFYKGALLPPIQPQNKYGFGIRSLPPLRQRLPSHTSRCHFLHVFPLLVPLYFSALPLCGNEGGQDFFHQALLIWWCPRTDWWKILISCGEPPSKSPPASKFFAARRKTGFLCTVLINVFSFWSEFGVLCFRFASSNTYSARDPEGDKTGRTSSHCKRRFQLDRIFFLTQEISRV